MDKKDFYKIYIKAHNNAVGLLSDAKTLFEKKKYPRAYFLAYTALEEISKSQLAADVYTEFIVEKDFWDKYRNHTSKINDIGWAHADANSYPYNYIWLGPDIDDVEATYPKEPLWEKRQNSLYIGIDKDDNIVVPENNITLEDAKEIIHIVDTALDRIIEITEYFGNQIGSKGFLK
jgi:AbiV family abortive infection protein